MCVCVCTESSVFWSAVMFEFLHLIVVSFVMFPIELFKSEQTSPALDT